MTIRKDGLGQPYIQWEFSPGHFRRVWVRYPNKCEKNYASTGRYLCVVRTATLNSGTGGNLTDFPIFSDVSDDDALLAFVRAVDEVTKRAP